MVHSKGVVGKLSHHTKLFTAQILVLSNYRLTTAEGLTENRE